MKQLTQNLKDGKMELMEIPTPSIGENSILVKNYYSAVSAGTEGRSIRDARMGYIAKAKARPKEFKQVLDSARRVGIKETYKNVMNKLTSPSSLGYSCTGEVVALGSNVKNFKKGDKVACGGQGAVHAEYVSVLSNLCVKVPDSVDLKYTAFTTIGSIVIQGIRQSEVKLGEYCAVIGLGLLGQFTIQILNAAGVKTIGIDIDKEKVKIARDNGTMLAIERNQEGIEDIVSQFTGGIGVDSVIITAATSSNDPVNLAGSLCRMKGKVVSVGRVATDFDRDTYYQKELDLRMSCSYGPGRYDVQYEEKGVDYPVGYVRWTENRNMQAYVGLLESGKINIDYLITHEFGFDEAFKAYDMINDNKEAYLGIVLKYDPEVEAKTVLEINNKPAAENKLNVGFIGAGSFAQKFLLPNIQEDSNMNTVATASGNKSAHVAKKYGFNKATCDANEVVNDPDINTVFIATRHNTHYEYVMKALQNNKNVFVEKPLCMTEDELEKIEDEYKKKQNHLMVGFNRRYAPQIQDIVKHMGRDTVKTINYRINLGPLDPGHWTQDPDIGGGRIIGEVCHFVDLSIYLTNSKPKMISAFAADDPHDLNNTVSVLIKFENGSVASINYFANGNSKMSKEYLEVFSNGNSAILDDFIKLTIFGKKNFNSKSNQNKGHAVEVKEFLDAVKEGKPTPISFDEIYWTTKVTFDIINSIKTKSTITY